MATVQESLFSIATTDADLSALIGTRFWPRGKVPKEPTLPFLVYQQISLPDDVYRTHDNNSGRDTFAFQIDGYAKNPHLRDELKRKVFLAFDSYYGGDVGHIFVTNQLDGDAPKFNAKRVITDIMVDHKR
jgi:hypothetical protein